MIDKDDIEKKYFGNSRINALGGGCAEPKKAFKIEPTSILSNSFLKRIDLGANIPGEQDRLRKMKQMKEQEKPGPTVGPQKKEQ